MVKVIVCLLTALAIHRYCHAQPADLPRLRAIVQEKAAKKDYFKDSSYIDALNNLAYAYYRISPDSLFLYCNRALGYAIKAGYGRGESTAFRQMGNAYRMKGDYTKMLSYYQQALAVAERVDDHRLIAKASINIAMEYNTMGKLDESLVLAERAKRLFEETGDSLDMNKSIVAIGSVWYERKQYDLALHYHQLALQLAIAMKNDYLVVTDNDAIGTVLLRTGKYKEALALYLRSLDYFKHTDDKVRHSVAAVQVGQSYLHLKQYSRALPYAVQGMQLASALHGKPEMKDASHVLAQVYEALGDYRNAATYFRLYSDLSDTLFNEQMLQNTARLEARYEYEKKEAALREQQAEKDARNRGIVRNKELQIATSILVIIFLAVLIFVLLRSRRAKQKANQVLAVMNEEITRQKEAIENQSLQLLLNNQQKDKLFSIISHDLKTPLQSLHTILDLLKTQALTEAQINRMIEELRQEVDYSSELVRNLLFWSNSQLNGIMARPVALHLQQLSDEVLEQFKKQAAQKEIMLLNRIASPLQAYADKDMINVVIRNLVSNAVKFCTAGDTITISGKATTEGIEICIADTGTGIEADIMEKINRQRIVTTYGTAGEKGTGLGLLLCREFIELSKGRFRVESTWKKGSRFCIVLPAITSKQQQRHALKQTQA